MSRVIPLALAIAILVLPLSARAVDRDASQSATAGRAAQPEVRDAPSRRVTVRFPRARSSVSVAGGVRGYEIVDYVLHAQARQQIAVRLTSASRFLTMAVYDPDKRALCIEACVDRWSGPVARTGDYIVRIGLNRAEARRNRLARYQIRFTLTSD